MRQLLPVNCSSQFTSSVAAVVLSAMILIVFISAAGAVLPPDSAQFVIVTTTELAAEFEPLATFKSDIGLPTRVVTIDWINSQVAPGVDQAATIRDFLQEAHLLWGTTYVLLGGSIDHVPTRWVYNSFFPTSGGTDIPADLYFSCLDGSWDADGDGIFCEPYVSESDPGDDADLLPEIALGRAPVTTEAEAMIFVQKSIAFHTQSGTMGLPRALIAADVLFPSDWSPGGYVILDGGTFGDVLNDQLGLADPPWLVDRAYENYTEFAGAEDVTPASLLAAMSTGDYRLVHHLGFGYGDSLSIGQGFVSGDQVGQLENEVPFFFVSLASDGAAHDNHSALTRAVLAPNGGCAIALGNNRASFPNAMFEYHQLFYQHALADPGTRVGDALNATFTDLIEYTNYNYVHRWTHQTLVLLGDPTLPISAAEIPVSIDDHETEEDELPTVVVKARLTGLPNPFNPLLEIRGELPAAGNVRLSVCDVRGRELRVLFDGHHEAGEANWRWNGTDREGRAAASGVYLLRMKTERRLVHTAVTLAR